jgi:formylglycine-generating enzyme required for sulfatase activity
LLIPEGQYTVGAKKPVKFETKEKTVFLNEFFVGKYPVTNALFETFVDKTGYRTTAEKAGYGIVYQGKYYRETNKKTGFKTSIYKSGNKYDIVKGACWYKPSGPNSSINKKLHHPVVQVSYEDATAFSAWIGKRLPTEVEWEAAARTRQGNIYPWGNHWINNACNNETAGISETTPVDQYLDYMNEYDLADLLGNVMEWTCDTIIPPYNIKSDSHYFIVKGGSWASDNSITLYSRNIFKVNYTSNMLGFRCVAE